MAIITALPCGGGVDVTYKVNIENTWYDLRFKYLQRLTNEATKTPVKADQWTLYFGLTGKTPFLVTPLKTNRQLLSRIKYHPDCPVGDLELRDYIADKSESTGGMYNPERVSFENLGINERFRLYYYPLDYLEGNM